MAYRHLELTNTLAAQREKLLRSLDGWNATRLDDTLRILSQKDAIRIQSPNESERILSLSILSSDETSSLIASFDSDQVQLYNLLERFIGKG